MCHHYLVVILGTAPSFAAFNNLHPWNEGANSVLNSHCVPNGPMFLHYVSAAANGVSNYSWQFNAGFESKKVNESNHVLCSQCKTGIISPWRLCLHIMCSGI